MKRIAIADYMFIFEPDQTWNSWSAFEADLADFFAAHGKQAQVVETGGNAGKKVLYIESMDVLDKVENMPKKFTPPSQVFKQFKQNAERNNKGFYKKRRR